MASVFPAPDHDHARCSADTMAHAEALCVERGQRLTPMRRHVLEILAGSHKPLGAYEIMDLAARSGPRPAPISVYRALDFLRENGLVHRIESRNAFVACLHNHRADALVAFLLCERCGAVGEAPGAPQAPRSRLQHAAPGSCPASRSWRSPASAPIAGKDDDRSGPHGTVLGDPG